MRARTRPLDTLLNTLHRFDKVRVPDFFFSFIRFFLVSFSFYVYDNRPSMSGPILLCYFSVTKLKSFLLLILPNGHITNREKHVDDSIDWAGRV